MSKKSGQRQRMEKYMKAHKEPATVVQIAEGMGEDVDSVRRRMQHLVVDGVAVNTTPGVSPSLYQHASHYRKAVQATQSNVASRRDPVTNSKMPNGTRAYWSGFMARFNEAPRSV